MAPGLAHLLAVLSAVLALASTVGDAGGGAHRGAGHQWPPGQHLSQGSVYSSNIIKVLSAYSSVYETIEP